MPPWTGQYVSTTTSRQAVCQALQLCMAERGSQRTVAPAWGGAKSSVRRPCPLSPLGSF